MFVTDGNSTNKNFLHVISEKRKGFTSSKQKAEENMKEHLKLIKLLNF